MNASLREEIFPRVFSTLLVPIASVGIADVILVEYVVDYELKIETA